MGPILEDLLEILKVLSVLCSVISLMVVSYLSSLSIPLLLPYCVLLVTPSLFPPFSLIPTSLSPSFNPFLLLTHTPPLSSFFSTSSFPPSLLSPSLPCPTSLYPSHDCSSSGGRSKRRRSRCCCPSPRHYEHHRQS